MNSTLAEYLTERQYRHICRYWRIFNIKLGKIRAIHVVTNLLYSHKREPIYTTEYTDIRPAEISAHITKMLREQEGYCSQLRYFEKEYEIFLTTNGFNLVDTSQLEILFNLLNNGI